MRTEEEEDKKKKADRGHGLQYKVQSYLKALTYNKLEKCTT